MPTFPAETVEAVREGCPGGQQLVGDDRRVLLVVLLLHSRGVLVPVGEQRIVLALHERETVVVDAEHVAHVRGVLERGPGGLVGALAHVGAGEHRRPGRRVRAEEGRNIRSLEGRRVEAALGAGLLENPGPVLGVRGDRHAPIVAHGNDRLP